MRGHIGFKINPAFLALGKPRNPSVIAFNSAGLISFDQPARFASPFVSYEYQVSRDGDNWQSNANFFFSSGQQAATTAVPIELLFYDSDNNRVFDLTDAPIYVRVRANMLGVNGLWSDPAVTTPTWDIDPNETVTVCDFTDGSCDPGPLKEQPKHALISFANNSLSKVATKFTGTCAAACETATTDYLYLTIDFEEPFYEIVAITAQGGDPGLEACPYLVDISSWAFDFLGQPIRVGPYPRPVSDPPVGDAPRGVPGAIGFIKVRGSVISTGEATFGPPEHQLELRNTVWGGILQAVVGVNYYPETPLGNLQQFFITDETKFVVYGGPGNRDSTGATEIAYTSNVSGNPLQFDSVPTYAGSQELLPAGTTVYRRRKLVFRFDRAGLNLAPNAPIVVDFYAAQVILALNQEAGIGWTSTGPGPLDPNFGGWGPWHLGETLNRFPDPPWPPGATVTGPGGGTFTPFDPCFPVLQHWVTRTFNWVGPGWYDFVETISAPALPPQKLTPKINARFSRVINNKLVLGDQLTNIHGDTTTSWPRKYSVWHPDPNSAAAVTTAPSPYLKPRTATEDMRLRYAPVAYRDPAAQHTAGLFAAGTSFYNIGSRKLFTVWADRSGSTTLYPTHGELAASAFISLPTAAAGSDPAVRASSVCPGITSYVVTGDLVGGDGGSIYDDKPQILYYDVHELDNCVLRENASNFALCAPVSGQLEDQPYANLAQVPVSQYWCLSQRSETCIAAHKKSITNLTGGVWKYWLKDRFNGPEYDIFVTDGTNVKRMPAHTSVANGCLYAFFEGQIDFEVLAQTGALPPTPAHTVGLDALPLKPTQIKLELRGWHGFVNDLRLIIKRPGGAVFFDSIYGFSAATKQYQNSDYARLRPYLGCNVVNSEATFETPTDTEFWGNLVLSFHTYGQPEDMQFDGTWTVELRDIRAGDEIQLRGFRLGFILDSSQWLGVGEEVQLTRANIDTLLHPPVSPFAKVFSIDLNVLVYKPPVPAAYITRVAADVLAYSAPAPIPEITGLEIDALTYRAPTAIPEVTQVEIDTLAYSVKAPANDITAFNIDALVFSPPPLPGPPIIQNVQNNITTSLRQIVSWTAPTEPGIIDYAVEYSTDEQNWTPVQRAASTATSQIVENLSPGTYMYRVAAITSLGVGDFSATSLALEINYVAPSVPTNLRVGVFGGGGQFGSAVTLYWSAPVSTGGGPITQYVVEWNYADSQPGAFNTLQNTVVADTALGWHGNFVVINGLQPGRLLAVRVAAKNVGNQVSNFVGTQTSPLPQRTPYAPQISVYSVSGGAGPAITVSGRVMSQLGATVRVCGQTNDLSAVITMDNLNIPIRLEVEFSTDNGRNWQTAFEAAGIDRIPITPGITYLVRARWSLTSNLSDPNFCGQYHSFFSDVVRR